MYLLKPIVSFVILSVVATTAVAAFPEGLKPGVYISKDPNVADITISKLGPGTSRIALTTNDAGSSSYTTVYQCTDQSCIYDDNVVIYAPKDSDLLMLNRAMGKVYYFRSESDIAERRSYVETAVAKFFFPSYNYKEILGLAVQGCTRLGWDVCRPLEGSQAYCPPAPCVRSDAGGTCLEGESVLCEVRVEAIEFK